MVAYKPLQRASAFRLWCKARGFDISEYDEVAKTLGDKTYTDEMFEVDHPKWKMELNYSKVFRGVIESVAPSPCSFLLSNNPISEEVGLIKVGDVICCAMDGYNCDVYKFLKNDLLTVSVYSIISKTYELIGRPIDDIGTLVNNCDEKVWNIYEKGLTTTINQADSDNGKQSVMRYKPKSLAELSAWVAAIRPGFASLLNNFLDRKPYSTGVKELDDLLEDSFHYLLYQESIMAYLVWLGIEEKGTYDIIKKIAKKKFKEEELNDLKDKLLKGWVKNVGTEKGFDDTWQVVEDAARYSFNASHALSVAIDSLYGAYLKAYYPLEYFTVALSLYSDDMERTAKLTEELPFFNIKLNNIKFGKSKSDYMMSREDNSIYKSIGSIKYCNKQIAEELYDLAQNNTYDNFIDLLDDIINKTSVDNRQLTILIGLNFFSDFGKNQYLLNLLGLYKNLRNAKQIKKAQMDKLGLSKYLMQKYAGKETEKMYKDIDNIGLITEMADRFDKNKRMSIVEQIKFEMEYLEYVTYTNSDISEKYWAVIDYKHYKEPRKPYFTLYNLKTGEIKKSKITSVKIYEQNPFGLYGILNIKEFTQSFKKKKVNDEWIITDEIEEILTNYEVMK